MTTAAATPTAAAHSRTITGQSVRALLVPRGNPWLFPGDAPGQPVKEIRRFWIGIQTEAKLPDVRIHDLRHTFASLLVSGGASLEMIGKLLGHSQMRLDRLARFDGFGAAGHAVGVECFLGGKPGGNGLLQFFVMYYRQHFV